MKICLTCEGVAADAGERQCQHCGTPLLDTDVVHYPVRRGEVDAVHPLLGTRVDGKYRVTGVLGRGGMGTVFRAVHEGSLVPVALKILHPRFAARADHRRAFLDEARKAGRVVHDHCARILDVGEAEDGTAYIAMELAQGETLAEWFQGGRILTPATVVEVLRQITTALAAAHSAGLVHRDLSTRNVMLSVRDGGPWVKVLDFGIARGGSLVLRASAEEAPVPGGEPAGYANPAFSAPEHLAGHAVDARADLYGLGVIAYQALAGELPVGGRTGREVARNTVEGRRKPLPSVPGVPRRLARLVERLLAHEPGDRPASAAEVLDELVALQQPRSTAAAPAALVALVLSVVLFTAARTAGPEPFLTLRPGATFSLVGSLPSDAAPVVLRSGDLGEVRCRFGGFPPHRLRAELTRRGRLLEEVPLRPRTPDEGLVLDRRDPGWSRTVRALAHHGREGAVDLVFVVPGHPPLGGARLLVDDEPPEVRWELQGIEAGLRPGVRGRVRVDDHGGLARAELEVRFGAAAPEPVHRVSIEVPEPGREVTIPIAEPLSRSFPDVADRGRTTLQLVVVDRAGHRGESEPVTVNAFDLGLPAIRDVHAPAGGKRVPYEDDRAAIRLDLNVPEEGLAVEVRHPNGTTETVREVEPIAGGLELEITARRRDPPFADGRYGFRLLDQVGNRHRSWFEEELSFHERSLETRLSLVDLTASAVVLVDQVVTAGEPLELRLECPGLTPREVSLAAPGEAPNPGHEGRVTLREKAAGEGLLALEILPPGLHTLHIDLVELGRPGASPVRVRHDVRVLPERVELGLPPLGDVRFLQELIEADVLATDADGLLVAGTVWQLSPADRRLVRCVVWAGGPESPRLDPLPPENADSPLFRPWAPRRGKNRLVLQVRDVLGRPVRARGGVGVQPDGRWVVAGFEHAESPPVLVDQEVALEHGQPARIRVRVPFTFEPADAPDIELVVDRVRRHPRRVAPAAAGGTRLEFTVPFGPLAAAAGVAGQDRTTFAEGLQVRFRAGLVTPAKTWDETWPLRTSRSLLRPVTLGVLGDGLPGALAGIEMVPFLGAEERQHQPVPPSVPGRALYRPPLPPVRGITDGYLQKAELTRAQYDAVLRALPGLARRNGLVHAADPLGPDRLGLEAMLPLPVGGDAELWRQRVEDGPRRPVTGVHWFQAYTATRVIGLLLAGDPDLLRLPLGAEMEVAALGVCVDRQGREDLRLHGARELTTAEFRRAAGGEAAVRERARELGDVVPAAGGGELIGLDFGVREWVVDLPYDDRRADHALVKEWLANAPRHLEEAARLAAGRRPEDSLTAHLGRFAVVRGLATGEVDGLVDGWEGTPRQRRRGPLPASVPGVVRTEILSRDGQDLLVDRPDPRLGRIGFRLAGSGAFIQRVRTR